FRIYPSSKQKVRIVNSLKTCKAIYNELLALNKDAYKFGQVSLSGFDFNKYLTGKYPNIHSQSKQNVSDRVHKAFKNFFRRVKENAKEKGFPRFKSRVNSITFPQSGFRLLSDKRLKLSKIGNIPIILHRVPKGKIKTLTIKQNKSGQWFAIFSCEVENKGKPIDFPQNSKIGIDVGIENFATLSNGETIVNPHFLIKAEHRLKRLQRRLSRKNKGSVNRRKARFRLAKQHIKVSNIRADWLHKLTKSLTLKYGTIAIEDLKIPNMVKNHHLAKSITDASWGIFAKNLEYKAVISGSELIEVNPRNTSKTCSECGTIVDMPLSKRKFSCHSCGFVCHRDLNASLNILKVGTDCAELNACGDTVRPSLKARVVEIGTINGSTSSL
ncbi:MAG: transposase, partial [Nanoarchaeota archaeon]|nr:transposase [Nanoarchaeota archaeon]